MTRALKTNPAYAYLAYRRAITLKAISFLQENFTSINGDDPKGQIICEEVFQADAEVPEEDINQFIEELRAREQHFRLEMGKFEFIKKGDENESQRPTSQGGRQKAAGKSRRKG